LTGTINLRGNPVSLATLASLIPLGASAKKYVDGAVAGAISSRTAATHIHATYLATLGKWFLNG
jgi:hypothetical protein